MTQKLDTIEILRQYETTMRTGHGVVRFITIVGSMPNVPIAGRTERGETYTCLVGPVMREYEYLGASSLPSISSVDASAMEITQCSIDASETEWDAESGRVELRVQVSGAGGAGKATILFSVTILAAA